MCRRKTELITYTHCTVARIINDRLAHDKQFVCYTQLAYAMITFKDTKNASCTGRDSIKISHTFLAQLSTCNFRITN